ncbi:uncharacterized protein PGTG_12243 [Puccinia graminis f. sp. tritici CRL 75-36-700-3]|uniref:Uncharacterized protein n=1 Tax=Puccinia graminis f. sp. tritici (strain CRL 75-36-700-3 / race SCCL) TaxID=418459 RepID=E3KPQ2_PUCGT|nr:uncharacterized protein PGTG_12243 [Puccinia graminis f. sp. tritici CRL 75-36-700-3]EFP86287.2 hypothetical protein PGTG_12243 [Puccinia graminis f. sp. tritici CRL 75-36-700-3]
MGHSLGPVNSPKPATATWYQLAGSGGGNLGELIPAVKDNWVKVLEGSGPVLGELWYLNRFAGEASTRRAGHGVLIKYIPLVASIDVIHLSMPTMPPPSGTGVIQAIFNVYVE